VKKISCREHQGGVFTIAAKPGRPPVRCTADNPCTAVRTKEAVSAKVLAANAAVREHRNPSKASSAPDFRSMKLPELHAYAREHHSSIAKLTSRKELVIALEKQTQKMQAVVTESVAKDAMKALESHTAPKKAEPKFRASDEVKTAHGRNKSLELAQKAKAQLVAQGWDVQGSAKGELVTISAHRGDELLSIAWKDGVAIDQNYSLWSVDMPSHNGEVPPHNLPFDPDWATDSEVAAHLVGMKVTWWNRISGKEEHGLCGHDTITIEHRFDGAGHEIPSERLIKFIDGAGGNFRLVQLGQLLKVGK